MKMDFGKLDICYCSSETCKRKTCFRHYDKAKELFAKHKGILLTFSDFDETSSCCPKHKSYLKRKQKDKE